MITDAVVFGLSASLLGFVIEYVVRPAMRRNAAAVAPAVIPVEPPAARGRRPR